MQQRIKHYQPTRIIGPASLGLLLMLALMLIAPRAAESTYAESASDRITTTANLSVNSMVAVALQSYINIDVVPQGLITFASNTAKLTVNTNNTSGYSVYMQTTNGSNDLVSVDSTNTRRVASIAETTSQENFTANTWGYSFDTDKRKLYEPVPIDAADPVLTTDTATSEDSYDLTFGVAVGADLPMGTYNNNVVISVIANPSVVTSLEQVTYMQGMSPDICRNTAEGVTKQLIDTRDGNKYWVAKLKDGNCWMTQNLALDITEAGLKATDTDIEVDWNKFAKLPPRNMNIATNWTAQPTAWNVGKLVLGMPDDRKACSVATPLYERYAADCANAGVVDVSGVEWQPTFTATEGTLTLPNGTIYEGFVAVDLENKTYDPHYLVGNYYNYWAASAGQTTALGDNMPGSICPKNWQIPVGNTTGDTINVKGSWKYLLKQYDLLKSGDIGLIENADYNVVKDPLYLIRAGILGGNSYPDYIATPLTTSSYYTASTNLTSGYWSLLSLTATQNQFEVAQSDRYKGYSIRCMIQSN